MEHKTKRVKRYTQRFKQELILGISAGLLSKSEASIKYGVSWIKVSGGRGNQVDRHGLTPVRQGGGRRGRP